MCAPPNATVYAQKEVSTPCLPKGSHSTRSPLWFTTVRFGLRHLSWFRPTVRRLPCSAHSSFPPSTSESTEFGGTSLLRNRTSPIGEVILFLFFFRRRRFWYQNCLPVGLRWHKEGVFTEQTCAHREHHARMQRNRPLRQRAHREATKRRTLLPRDNSTSGSNPLWLSAIKN